MNTGDRHFITRSEYLDRILILLERMFVPLLDYQRKLEILTLTFGIEHVSHSEVEEIKNRNDESLIKRVQSHPSLKLFRVGDSYVVCRKTIGQDLIQKMKYLDRNFQCGIRDTYIGHGLMEEYTTIPLEPTHDWTIT